MRDIVNRIRTLLIKILESPIVRVMLFGVLGLLGERRGSKNDKDATEKKNDS